MKVAQKSKLKPQKTLVTMAIFDEFREFAFKGNIAGHAK